MNKQAILSTLFRQYGELSFLPKQARREVLNGMALADVVEILESECVTELPAWDFHKGGNSGGCLAFDRQNEKGYLGWRFVAVPQEENE